MDGEKVKAIKKDIDFCTTKIGCEECSFMPIMASTNCRNELLKNCLILINEMESENERLKEQNGALSCDLDYVNEKLTNAEIEVDDYKDRIAKLEKENKDYYDRLNNAQTYIDNHEEVWKGNTKIQLQQFAERLKEKDLSVPLHKDFMIIDNKSIDETLKEFL